MTNHSNETPSNERTGQVRAVLRAMTLLREIAASDGGLTLTSAAAKAGLPASTTHRLLTTMEGERFVRYDMNAGMWQIGVNAFVTGAAFVRTRNLTGLARPFLRRLVDSTGETANIFVESGGQVVCLDQMESRHAMRAMTQVGARLPMHASGSGKALLSMMSRERREGLLDTLDLPALTAATITDRATLDQALTDARHLGYATDYGEHFDGLGCAAAVIFGETGDPIAAVSVSGPQSRLVEGRMSELGQYVRKIALEITNEYGGRAP
ncbi:transcriptional regulator, IclR family [Monaibacterium marinum]|uniref:Transcriptional regulator, IclR family n=1 Tax=Pontivivens marinum TaxID=1690039 RepID=A0A2C9CVD0_9RHOB|nr:IclR family transcriptional regulator C-terminal domain-containing protein [Monaibacterium marinum]SOH95222.1 transcriptional regulator, IclR family [Monaibacterium marinum]